MRVLIAWLIIASTSLAADRPGKPASNDWPWWRGPTRNGIAGEQPAPLKWSTAQNVLWKARVPGRGHSSPTVVGNLVVMQTALEARQIQSVVAYDRRTGKPRWQRIINTGGFPGRINRKNTHASTTVAGDGKSFFAVALHHDAIHVTALSSEGQVVWQKRIGPFRPDEYKNGYACSPIIYGQALIVLAECDDVSYLVSLDRATGKQNWRTTRPAAINYSSPVLARVAGRDQLLLQGCYRVGGFDPAKGAKLWEVSATTMATAGTMVWHKDLVFASGGYPKAGTVCVRADGSGTIVWQNLQKCYEQSMIAVGGYLYAMTDGGIVFCWRATDGKEMWKKRLRGPVSASPVYAAGNIYMTNELGMTFVFQATPTAYVEVARNQLGNVAFATLSICGGRIYTRVTVQQGGKRQEFLYAIGDRRAAQLPPGIGRSGTER